MKLRLVLFVMLFSTLGANAQYVWHDLPAAPISWRFDDFYFTNPRIGWAINPSYNYLTPKQYGRIFKTIDGGSSWQKFKDSSGTFFRSVGFADSLTGWVGNIADTEAGPGGIPFTTDTIPLYETHDGGNTWHPANLPHPHPSGICGISVITDSVVLAYGRFYGPAGYVKTVDKGASWAYTDMNSQALGLIDGHFFGKDTGFITGMGTDHKAIILATVDGGATWNACYHSTRVDSDRVWKIYFPSRNVGYATIEYGGSQYTYTTWYLKTTDGGLHWTEYPFFSTYDEEGVGFINDSTGWIGGDFLVGTYVTHDGGTSWAIDPSFGIATPPFETAATAYSINRFRGFGDTLMYASGNTLYKLTPGSTEVKEQVAAKTGCYNFPNPFSGQTTIVYALPEAATNVTLQITNVLGEQVCIRNLGPLNSGPQQFIFGEQLPQGIYHYSITTDRSSSMGRMTVAR